MQDDFTRINFGWWRFNNETQSDIFEYGTSRAAAWDCPACGCKGITSKFCPECGTRLVASVSPSPAKENVTPQPDSRKEEAERAAKEQLEKELIETAKKINLSSAAADAKYSISYSEAEEPLVDVEGNVKIGAKLPGGEIKRVWQKCQTLNIYT